MSQLLKRVVGALSVSVVLIGLLAGPAAAGPGLPVTRLVDDNGVQCPSAAYTSIQDAIDDANTGDKVFVCPGTYTEQLTINKSIIVKAQPMWGAHLNAPAGIAPTNGVVAAVAITADNATFRGFRMHIDSGPVVPTARPTAISCTPVDVAILVLGNNDAVRHNRINATGSATLSGACGYGYGIAVGRESDPATANVTFNKIRDFKFGGILIEGAGTTALVRRNAVQYLHLAESGITPCIATGCAQINSVNGSFAQAFGIGVEDGADARIVRNAIKSGPNAVSGNRIIVGTPALGEGISVMNTDSGDTWIKHNAIWRTSVGITTASDVEAVDVFENHVTTSFAWGMILSGTDAFIYDNVVQHNNLGTLVNGANNNLHDNDFRDNDSYDCWDQTSGGGTAGTANTWTNNLGQDDNPDGICVSPV